MASNGRFGPYVKSGDEIRSIPPQLSPLDITLERAVEMLMQPKGRRRADPPKALRELGKHPVTQKPLVIKSGRYGAYVTDGELNATLRRGMMPESLTIEDAVNLLDARAARLAANPDGRPARKTTLQTKKKVPKKATHRQARKTSQRPTHKGGSRKESNVADN